MAEIIDLSQEIFSGMPTYHSLPPVTISTYATHEQWDKIENPRTQTPSVLNLEMSEHTGTHVDALNHMGIKFSSGSIDRMPLSIFYTEGICIDLSHKGLQELINTQDLKTALEKAIFRSRKEILFYFIPIIIGNTTVPRIGEKVLD
ncbi:cyclase family protein [Algoriphagus halophilus]